MSTFGPSSFPTRSSNRFFRRRTSGDQARRRARRNRQRLAHSGVEQLEQRLALTVEVAFDTSNPILTGPGEDWVVVVADSRNGQDTNADGVVRTDDITDVGSDVFLMVASTPTQDLFVADNASFVDRITLQGVNGRYENIYVYNGTVVSRDAFVFNPADPGNATIESFFGVPDKYIFDGNGYNQDLLRGYPFSLRQANTSTLSFMLPSEGIDWFEDAFITINLNTGNPGDVVQLQHTAGVHGVGVFAVVNSPVVQEQVVTVVTRSAGSVDPQLIFDIPLSYPALTGMAAEPTMRINYDVDVRRPSGSDPRITRVDAVNIGAARDGTPIIEVFDDGHHVYVPGTFQSNLQLRYGETRFRTAQVQESGLLRAGTNSSLIPISFNNSDTDERNVTAEFGGFRYWDDEGAEEVLDIRARGELNTSTGFTDFEIWVDTDPNVFRPFSFVMTRAVLAVQDIGPAVGPGSDDPFFTVPDLAANDFTLFPGHNLTTGLTVELSNADSRISMESPLVVAAATGRVSLAAEEINVNAPLRAPGAFVVPEMAQSAFGTITERMTVNAAVSSSTFDIRMRSVRSEAPVGEMLGTMDRGLLNVTQTGLLSNDTTILDGIALNPASANSLFVEMVDGDVYLEGRVVALFQSYLVQSPEMVSQRRDANNTGPQFWSTLTDFPQWAPYHLTTASRLTGVDVGSIEGNTVAITLANDSLVLPDPNDPNRLEPFDPSRAFSVLDITTDIARLRVQASDRVNDLLEQPFPYRLNVREENSMIVDAVAASSEKIDIFANGLLTILGKVESAADVHLESTAEFTLSAPLSTRFGAITILAPEINLQNSVRVLDGPQDERDTDIFVHATDGDLLLQDAVSGINRVILRQDGDGEIAGSARVFADVIEVRGTSDVALRTRGNRVSVRAPGVVSIDERDYGIFEIRDAVNVTLVANGFDQIVRADTVYDMPYSENGRFMEPDRALISPALYADVYDTRVLTVSAPNGSIDVFHQGAQSLSIGDISSISTGTATPMVAAGSVSIRSTLAEITVRDAPTAAGSAKNVRVATTEPLQGWDGDPASRVDAYTGGLNGRESAGVLPGRLQRVRITRTQEDKAKDVNGNYLPGNYGLELDGIDVTTLRLGDRILVKEGHINGDPNTSGVQSLVSNGTYRILSIHYPVTFPIGNQPGGTAPTYVELDLIRADEADTTAELGQKHYVRVAEGNTYGGKVLTADGSQTDRSDNGTQGTTTDDFDYQSYNGWGTSPVRGDYASGDYAFANVFENDVDVVPTVVRAIPSQTGYVTAMAVTQEALTGVTFSRQQQTITGNAGDTIPAIDGVNLIPGDRVLVRYGATSTPNDEVDALSAGLYVVDRIGGAQTPGWQLSRYNGIDENGDGKLDWWYTGRVAIDQGTDRSAVTGEMFEVAMESLGYAALRYRVISEFTIDTTDPYDAALFYKVDIGSNNPTAPLTYIVSTENGINSSNALWFGERSATSSFGRMLTLLQGNAAVNERTGEAQDQALEFDPSVRRINLVQALPAIYRPISITAASGVTIDGTQIERNEQGAVIRSGSVITSIGPVRSANAAVARRLFRPGRFATNQEVHGIHLRDTADGASIQNLYMGGFNNGSAIRIEGADNVEILGVTLGADADGIRLSNKVGIEIIGNSVAQDGNAQNGVFSYTAGTNEHTTIRNSTILNSTNAGIILNVGSDRVHLVGNTIGVPGQSNRIGVLSQSSSEIPAYIGSASILGSTLVQLTGTVSVGSTDVAQNRATITIVDSELARQIRQNMVIYDEANGIVRVVKSVEAVHGGASRQVRIVVDNATATSAAGEGALYTVVSGNAQIVNPNTDFQIGHLVESVNEAGVVSNAGKVTVGDLRIKLPATIDARDVYLGQSVSSAQPGIALGSSIEEIETMLTTTTTDRSRQEVTTVTLTQPISETGVALLLFAQPAANRFTGNEDAIVLKGTSSSVVNSIVSGSIYDGIRIEDSSELTSNAGEAINNRIFGTHVIGDASGAVERLIENETLGDAGGDTASVHVMRQTPILANTPVTGTVYVGSTAVQTFVVNGVGQFTFTDIGTPVAKATAGTLDRNTGKIELTWNNDPGPNSVVVSYRHTPAGVLSQQNVSIYGNQLSGIRFTDRAFAALAGHGFASSPNADTTTHPDYQVIDSWLDNRVRITGNYIGFNPVISRAAGNGPTGVSNIVIQLDPGDPADSHEDRIREILITDTEFNADGVTPLARLKASTVDGHDSQENRHGIGGIVGGGDTDRVTTPPRRPIIR